MFTQYLISIKVYNPEGSGPETIVVVMTDEGGQFLIQYERLKNFTIAPSTPRNLRVISVQSTSIHLSWTEPARPNGEILGYRLYFRTGNLTSMHQIEQNRTDILETLELLRELSLYLMIAI